uniref:ZP domain-containing protein n=1 Tax=Heterorhabditis bacteriophora TaxID=37862 RepID=A0A1I7WBY7_HETBA
MADGVRIPLEVGVHGFVEVALATRAALVCVEAFAATRCWRLHAEPAQSSQRCISAGYVEKGRLANRGLRALPNHADNDGFPGAAAPGNHSEPVAVPNVRGGHPGAPLARLELDGAGVVVGH